MSKHFPKTIEVDGVRYVCRDLESLDLNLRGNMSGGICINRCALGQKQTAETGEKTTADNCRYTHLCMGHKNIWKHPIYFNNQRLKNENE